MRLLNILRNFMDEITLTLFTNCVIIVKYCQIFAYKFNKISVYIIFLNLYE